MHSHTDSCKRSRNVQARTDAEESAPALSLYRHTLTRNLVPPEMKKQHNLIEIHSVAARPHKRGGTEKTREHHFPLYSHPMFRAALHNADAVQDAVVEQSGRVDPRALDKALENMVAQLMEQQLNLSNVEGDAPPTLTKRDLVVTESELLKLLAEATHTMSPSSHPQPPSAALSSSSPEAVAAMASVTGASSPPPQQGPFIPNPGYRPTRPLLKSNGDTEHRVGSLPHIHGSFFPDAATAFGGDKPDELNVVSVDALQQAARKPHGHDDDQLARQISPSLETAAPMTLGKATRPKEKSHGGCSTRSKQHLPITSLYSLLPCLVAPPGLTTASALPVANSSSSSPSPSSVAFHEMDRRPGTDPGPVAQQSVDAQQLHETPDAVFAAMDVLMDGNSRCLRRRRRLVATNRNRAEVLSLNPRCLPGSGGGASGGSCFAFGCGNKGASLNRMYVPSAQNTLPTPPPPRTAAEAKARRILENQRRKQRLQDQQQRLVSNSSLLTGIGHNAVLTSSLVECHSRPTNPPADSLSWRHIDQLDSKNYGGSTSLASLPAVSFMSGNSAVVVGASSAEPLSQEASPAFTLRGIAGDSVYVQAIRSANRYAVRRL
ncbi:hypothetical protein, conserved [Leishmania tarentolae]|uniref:Uncharacterized protein n=1 Tax=Leishmania tarentolae TaxID=5689 RepID=A0A640KI08_LEITA|nr:hypothetical protein, conserved [Leishmania tarentolae]